VCPETNTLENGKRLSMLIEQEREREKRASERERDLSKDDVTVHADV
jgi:hypothetical protein